MTIPLIDRLPHTSSGWLGLLALSGMLAVAPAVVQTNASAPAELKGPTDHQVPDVTLINQNGEPVRLCTDVLQGKTVALNFIFTGCTSVCPLLGAEFAQVQQRLGDRQGKDIFLVSISLDPEADTPERLRTWAKQFNARPGWILLTGRKEELDKALKALNAFVPDKSLHGPVVLVNRGADGWTRFNSFTSAEQISDLLLSAPISIAASTPKPNPARDYTPT